MKKISIIAVIIVLISGYAFTLSQIQPGKTAKPDIYFENPSYDFGTITEGTSVDMSFKFYNSGKAPLLLKNVKPACGCTASEWPKEPIMPGKSGVIKATFHSNGYKGQNVHKSITVTTNIDDNGSDKVIVLYFKGFVK